MRGQTSQLPERLKPVQSWDAYLQQLAGRLMLDVPSLPDMAYPVHPANHEQVAGLNAPISLGEVLEGLQKLQNGRAKGPQRLPSELLRYARLECEAGATPPNNVLVPALVALLNCAFREGRIHSAVSGSLVTPVFKRGDPGDPANDRPITVTDAIMRLYANILNTRIVNFTEASGLRADSQAGFRSKLSTVHQVFSLQHFIDKHQKLQQPLYSWFLDLKGAYDRVKRDLLWDVLRRLGIDGRMLGVV